MSWLKHHYETARMRMVYFLRQTNGSAVVETALIIPALLLVGFFCVDIYKIHLARTQLEQMAGSVSMTISVQKKLEAAGLNGLYNTLVPDTGRFQAVITNVSMPSKKIWWSLQRGDADVCQQQPQQGEYYSQDLPGQDDDAKKDNHALVVVQLCEDVSDLHMERLLVPDQFKTAAVNRAAYGEIELDDALLGEATGAIKEKDED